MAELGSTGQTQTTLRDFLNVVFKRKYLILSIVGIVTVLVFVLNARKPVLYESSSRILVRRGEQSDYLTGAIRYLGWAEEVASQIQVILSDEVFARARVIFADSLRSRGLPQSISFAPAAVRAEVVGESNAFVIRYVNLNPVLCPIGCEAMTLAFEEYYRERKQPPELSDFFNEEIMDVRAELEQWRERRKEFLNREQFYGADQTSGVLMQRIGNLEGELLDLDKLISAQALRVENLEDFTRMSGVELEENLAYSTVTEELYQTGIVQQIQYRLQDFQREREELEQKYTEKHPELLAVNKQIEGLRQELKGQVENAHRVAISRLEQLKGERAEVVKELDKTRHEWEAMPDRDRQLSEIDAAIKRLEAKLAMLVDSQSQSKIAVASRSEWEVSVLSHAGPPIPKRTRDYVRMALGPMLAFIVSLGIAFFLESLDHSLKNIAEVEEYLDTKVLATISEFK
jgi:uncharacterized protein involved in exopolysaccharide biosynthesis